MLNFGGFLSSNFWSNYRCQSSASIEDLLNSKDCSVDKLLDDDDCLQEFKNYNDKLIKYFDHDKLKTLIDYITVMPTPQDGHNRGHKYPFISGEIFNCEINQLLDRFFEAPVKVKEAEDDKDSDADNSDDDKSADKKKSEDADKDETTAGATNLEEKATESTTSEEAKSEDKDENPQANEEKDSTEADATEEAKTDATEAANDEEKKETSEESTDNKEEAKEEVKDEQKNAQEPESEEQENKKADEPAEEEKKSEPEEEAEQKKDDNESATPISTEATAIETVPTEGEEKEEEPENKFVLLDRLFQFIDCEEEDLNPVLSGYFCKLVSLLISRKQKSLVPYIFAPESKIIDQLLRHVYQKSISEVLNKLLTQLDSDFEPSLQEQIRLKQQHAVSTLISQLGPEKTQEHNLNTCTIIQDMFESKEFFNILCQKNNLETVINYATVPFEEGSKSSKTSSLQILNQIVTSLNDKQNKKGKESEKKELNIDEDDDDMIVQQKSDDEDAVDLEEGKESNPNSVPAQINNLVDILKTKIETIEQILRPDQAGDKIVGSVTSVPFVPLGQQRLLTVELVHNMVQLKKEVLLTPISTSPLLTNIIGLVKAYPWNNFLQLKVMNLYTEVIEKQKNEEFRKQFLETSGITQALIEMGGQAWFTMESERKIRNGFMNLVVQVSNQLKKRVEPPKDAVDANERNEDATVQTILDAAGEEWRAFVDGELKSSNDNNAKNLGGSTTKNDKDSENEDNNYDVQMEKIMARFTNFNQILSAGNNDNQDEDSDEDGDATQDDDKKENFDEDDDDDDGGQQIQKVDVKAPGELVKEYCDNNYWDMGANSEEIDVDSLIAELDD